MQSAVAKAFAEGAGVKAELEQHGVDVEGKWALTVLEAARLLGVSRGKMYELIASGQVPSITIGKLRRVPLKEFREWVDA